MTMVVATTACINVAGCARHMHSPIGTWRGSDDYGGNVALVLGDNGHFQIEQHPDGTDPRLYKASGTYEWDLESTSNDQIYDWVALGTITFFIKHLELEGENVRELRMNPKPDDGGSCLVVDQP